ncbi:two-component system phosphate regulon sensor histidine kinase PhoR [Virgibacillus natechei]|uniref:histidine kinase n=1 Tax=Virgibacillus natechei TaxID=1216297 RepID=A0ABS4ID47_9BACI|nr:HAMP domain-containing sensor histidine kinase [Virgibacillus natechei]MBP1968868.1 two-component system phosphate regulon sensor histidine kinase PhoR [Virgibacillus natechei]UZD11663.1 ATP-binding protein [Virgibacillus natechei]
MKALFTKPLFSYVLGVLILLVSTGFVLSLLTDNYIILSAVLLTTYVILIIFMLHIFTTYIKPIKKVTKTVDEMVKGNYRARFHYNEQGDIGKLSSKVNLLARNLSELSIQEQMHSEQLSSVINNTESGLVLIDERGYIHLVNRKFISLFGETTKDYNGYLYYEVINNEHIHETIQNTFLYEKKMKEAFTHYKGVHKHYLEIVGAPIFNERNMLKGAVLVLYDITELKKLELMRKDFVANVSHELKTPITSIKGFSETLLDSEFDDDQSRNEFLGIIYNESHRLQLLIEDLLSLSNLEKEDFQLDLSEVQTKALANEVVPALKYKAEQNQIHFTMQIEDITFTADKERIKQVFINLVDNAIHYTPDSGEVTLLVDATEEHVHIKVEDTGMGMEQKILPRIFERFYRVDKARSRNTGGTGLGLAIVKHIVEVHGGEITIDSELDKGTAVHVYLPRENLDNKTTSL